MGRLVTALALLLAVAALGGAFLEHQARSTPAAVADVGTFDPNGSYSAAEKLVVGAVESRYDYHPEVGCPTSVAETRGTMFTCEALVRNRLVPITLEVFSRVGGFIHVVGVGLTTGQIERCGSTLGRYTEAGCKAWLWG